MIQDIHLYIAMSQYLYVQNVYIKHYNILESEVAAVSAEIHLGNMFEENKFESRRLVLAVGFPARATQFGIRISSKDSFKGNSKSTPRWHGFWRALVM